MNQKEWIAKDRKRWDEVMAGRLATRKALIMEVLSKQKNVGIKTLVAELEMSQSSIRPALYSLIDDGKLRVLSLSRSRKVYIKRDQTPRSAARLTMTTRDGRLHFSRKLTPGACDTVGCKGGRKIENLTLKRVPR